MTQGDDLDRSMTALVEYQIRAENTSMPQWLEVWSRRADDALLGEPETGAYAAAVNVEEPSHVLVFERYDKGRSSVKAHVERPAHKALTDDMGARNMTRRRVLSASFYDVPEFGWWSRPAQTAGTAEGAVIVVLGFRFPNDALRDAYLELSGEHASYCWAQEPDTLIYSCGIAAADADRELDLLQGDMVFVMACTDMQAVDKHANDPRHLALGPKFEALGLQLEPTFMRTYATSGKGYLWRDEAA